MTCGRLLVHVCACVALTVAPATAQPLPSAAAVPVSRDEGARTVALLKQLIAIDTSNAPGDTTAVAQLLRRQLEPLGAAIEIVTAPNGKAAHFIARIRGNGSRRPILLAAHADVVPVDRSRWSQEPFAGVERDGYLWGRGAIDNKGSLAIFTRAVMRLLEEKVPLARDIILLAEADEEQGAFNTTWLAREHWDQMDAEFVLNEGGKILTDDQGTTRQVQVSVIDKATLNIRLHTTGPSRHSSIPPPVGATANGQLIAALARLVDAAGPIRILPEVEAHLRSEVRLHPGPRAEALTRLLAATTAGDRESAVRALHVAVPDEAPALAALVRDTLTITMVNAGLKANVIPGEAEAVLNARLLPGSTAEALVEEIQMRIGNPEVQVELISSLPKAEQADFFFRRTRIAPSPVSTDLYAALQRQARRLWPQADVVPTLLTGATDATPWRLRGVPVYGLNPYPLHPSLTLTTHGDDERVSIEAVYQGSEYIFEVLRDVAGLPR